MFMSRVTRLSCRQFDCPSYWHSSALLNSLSSYRNFPNSRFSTSGNSIKAVSTEMANIVEVPKKKLNDGTEIPILAFGTGTAWYKKSDDEEINRELVDTIKTAIKLGYRHLDGAESYGTEAEIGLAIKESGLPRESFFVTTKVSKNIADISKALDSSLRKLKLDYVDLYLIHSPFFAESDKQLQDAWQTMEVLKKNGKARSIGVSNYQQSHLQATLQTATIPPTINQIEFHPYLQDRSLVEFQSSKGIATACYGLLAPLTKAKGGPIDDTLDQLTPKYAVGEGEIILRWALDQEMVVITTSYKESRLSDYLRTLTFKLTPREVQEISQKGEGKKFRGFWTHHFDSPNAK